MEEIKKDLNVEIDLNVDAETPTFKNKIEGFLKALTADKENAKEEIEWHKLIVESLKKNGVVHTNTIILEDSIKETEKFVKVLEERETQGKKLFQFLNGEFVLDFDRFVFLLMDILGSQMVNYVELKNEFEAVAKLWTTGKKAH